MREIVSGRLWLAGAVEARDARRLFDLGIAAVVDLAIEEPPAQLPREIAYLRVPLVDGQGNDPRWLSVAVGTLLNLLAIGVPTLVCCSGGMSRSPAVAAAAMASLKGQSLEVALLQIIAEAPHDVSPLLLKDLATVVAEQV